MKETVLVICAHNDDQILGLGGTLAKYAEEGKKILSVIFSYGESSHPWLKEEVTTDMRIKESERADKFLYGNVPVYLGIKEGKFEEDRKEIIKRLVDIIMKNKPGKVFTHCLDDPHPDHRGVLDIVLESLKKAKHQCDVYSFNVWNPINIRKRNSPKLIVDTSKTFNKKLKAFKMHKSQKMTFFSLWWNVYKNDRWNGFKNECKYAEVFFKIK